MFCYETSKIIIILIMLIVKSKHTIALDLRFKDISYELKDQLKSHKHNVKEQYEFNPINENVLEDNGYRIKKDLFENQLPYKLKYSNEAANENYVRKSNQTFGFEDANYDYNYSDSSDQITRRDITSGILQNTSLYPSVLTKAFEMRLNSTVPINTGGNLLNNVAQKMNTSALDLAKIITKTDNSNSDDQFSKLIENYKTTKEMSNPRTIALESTPSKIVTNYLQKLQKGYADNGQHIEEHVEDIAASNLAAILDHVLNKLEVIQKMKNYEDNDEEHPDGVPCDIIGSWSSTILGFCFDIQIHKDRNRYISPAEINNKVLLINVTECIPAKHHKIIDMDWKFTGSAIKQWGGPFYLYGQKKSEGILSTFLGFCRTCDGIDTIFGTWNILLPTKDCHDINLGSQVRQDILRRVRMETKRKERFKNLLYQSRHGKL